MSGVWGAPYLKHIHALDNIERGSVLLLMALGGISGHYFYGRLARYFNTLKWPILVGGSVILMVALMMAIMTRPPLWFVTTLFVMTSICSAYPAVVMAHGRGLVPARLMGRGVAVANMGIMTAIAGAQVVFGLVIGAFPAVAGAPPEIAYRTAFGVQAAMALVGLVVLGPVRDVRPRG
jgi:predicted MFS family arabinose efflux permease